jgi:hypothetical protein
MPTAPSTQEPEEWAMTNRRNILGVLAAGGVLAAVTATAAESVREEAAEHPRIAHAIHELEEAIHYMEAAPHDFGGHKAQALADSRAAVISLRKALAYRAAKDNRKG